MYVCVYNSASDHYHRFTVRDFVYNEEELQAGKNEIIKLSTDKKKQFVSSLTQLINMNAICWLPSILLYSNMSFISLVQ